jgi:site-specific DNA-methyltransferase (adenine-specific)
MINLTNEDNMELMSRYNDNHFELAIVDPPYGIGDKFKGGKSGKMNFNEVVDKGWDNEIPKQEYFDELFRVSKNQIIWGGNYFLDNLENTRCFIVWDKKISEDFSLAMAEFAWTSFDKLAKIFRLSVPKIGGKIHPTQKPVKLYEWLLMNYANEGDKILDTHLGSGSIAIACHNLGFDLTACELDKEYYDAACKRLKQHQAQLTIFDILK